MSKQIIIWGLFSCAVIYILTFKSAAAFLLVTRNIRNIGKLDVGEISCLFFLFFFEAGNFKSFHNMRPLVHWSIDSCISWSVGDAFLDPLAFLTRSLSLRVSEAQSIDCKETISWFVRLVVDVSARSTIPSLSLSGQVTKSNYDFRGKLYFAGMYLSQSMYRNTAYMIYIFNFNEYALIKQIFKPSLSFSFFLALSLRPSLSFFLSLPFFLFDEELNLIPFGKSARKAPLVVVVASRLLFRLRHQTFGDVPNSSIEKHGVLICMQGWIQDDTPPLAANLVSLASSVLTYIL